MENAQNDVEDEQFVSQRGRSNTTLRRIDGKPFESPRGRGRGNPGWGRQNGMPFVSQRGRVTHVEALAVDPDTASGSSYGS